MLLVMACIPASSRAQQPGAGGEVATILDWRLSRQLTQGVLPGAYLPATQSGLNADTLRTGNSYVQNWRPLRTFALVEGFNIIMTMFGQYVMDPEDGGFNVTWESVQQNLENGFEWDDNAFMTNNFRHPWMGALMFGAARSNDYDFYQSSLWAFAGSWLYEYSGEKHHPAYNDWINTSIGGMSFGESLYRLSNMVLDNTATGNERAWRELGGLILQPLAGVNRMITGQAFDVYANPEDRFPDYFATKFEAGLRTYGQEMVWDDEITKAYIEFDLSYGSMFDGHNEKPFDAFTFGIDITFDDQPRTISNMDIRGELASLVVGKTENTQHVLSAVQNFDYYDVDAYTFGGQSFSADFNSRFWKDEVFEAQTELKLTGIILGASRSDYFNISGREYDYGPGLGYAFRANFEHKAKYRLSMRHSGFWIHSLNGTEADHYASYTDAAFDLTIKQYLGVGLKYILYLGENLYERHPDTSTRDPEIRLYLSWLAD
jgi:hypothetical protein